MYRSGAIWNQATKDEHDKKVYRNNTTESKYQKSTGKENACLVCRNADDGKVFDTQSGQEGLLNGLRAYPNREGCYRSEPQKGDLGARVGSYGSRSRRVNATRRYMATRQPMPGVSNQQDDMASAWCAQCWNLISDSLDQVESQMDSNAIYYFEFQTWNLALQPT